MQERKTIEEYTELFMSTGRYPIGTIFIPNMGITDGYGRYNKWSIHCPICAQDQYSIAGLCDGIFKSEYSSLRRGYIPCRCSKSQKLTDAQHQYRVKMILESEDSIFMGFDSLGITRSTKFRWVCNKGHGNHTSLNNFLVGQRCSGACKYENLPRINGGIYLGKEQAKDNLYLLNLFSSKESFLKIGRSFDVLSRVSDFEVFYEVDILAIVSGEHSSVVSLEREVHKKLGENHYTPFVKFKGSMFECFSEEILENLDVREIFSLN